MSRFLLTRITRANLVDARSAKKRTYMGGSCNLNDAHNVMVTPPGWRKAWPMAERYVSNYGCVRCSSADTTDARRAQREAGRAAGPLQHHQAAKRGLRYYISVQPPEAQKHVHFPCAHETLKRVHRESYLASIEQNRLVHAFNDCKSCATNERREMRRAKKKNAATR